MKNRAIIFLISVVVIVYFFFLRNDVTIKSISYGDCIIHYEYSSSNFRNDKSNIRTHGHGKSNELGYEIAQHDLMKCLCDKYQSKKDKAIKEVITEYVKNDYLVNRYYMENVFALNAPIDSLCKYKKEIFEFDSVYVELCNQYQLKNDEKLKTEIILQYQKNVYSRLVYCALLKIQTIDNPNIDSICKYKDIVFGPVKND
jgi:hypothetical protein